MSDMQGIKGLWYTPWEISYLRAHWPDVPKIAAYLRRSRSGVTRKGEKMGLPPVTPPRDTWTEEQTTQLYELWGTMRASEMVEIIGRSRGAILGRANRLGLSKATPSSIARLAAKRREATRPRSVPLLDLERRDCRWIISGEGAEALFCGAPAVEGKSWCAVHDEKIWRKDKPPQPDQWHKGGSITGHLPA